MYTKKQIIDGYENGIFSAREALGAAGLANQRAAALWLGVTLRTLQRWLEKNKLPRAVVWACRYRAGDMSGIGGAGLWEGFAITGDTISNEYNDRISKADILKHNRRMYDYVIQQAELADLKRRYVPDVKTAKDAPAPLAANVVPFQKRQQHQD